MRENLIIAPHLDDEVIGCGGILDESFFVYFCGLQDHHILPATERLKELDTVQNIYGFRSERNPNGVVNEYVGNEFIDPIQNLINERQPKTIYIPYPSYNQDHQQIYNASMIALRPHDKNWFVKRVLVYEELDSIQWYNTQYEVNHFVEIDIERKLEGYKRHASQVRGHRSFQHMKALATLRGSQMNVPYAEAFIIKRWVK